MANPGAGSPESRGRARGRGLAAYGCGGGVVLLLLGFGMLLGGLVLLSAGGVVVVVVVVLSVVVCAAAGGIELVVVDDVFSSVVLQAASDNAPATAIAMMLMRSMFIGEPLWCVGGWQEPLRCRACTAVHERHVRIGAHRDAALTKPGPRSR
ncbi:MAG: hypothetical protein HOQ02_03500 [Lysobacter sp.]|nr:hypothetical protein [Lysobacter sp.]